MSDSAKRVYSPDHDSFDAEIRLGLTDATTPLDADAVEIQLEADTSGELCGCEKCVTARIDTIPTDPALSKAENAFHRMRGPGCPGWRYCCELCGNKRCPHHTDHTLACTRSNKPGQAGSSWQGM